jgi:hypothetical protein
MKLTWIIKLTTVCALAAVMIVGCKKDTSVKTPPEIATFTNQTGGTYFITAPGVTYKIPVGFTTVSAQDRTITVSVTSPTGAVAGTHYTLSSTTVTIPAGKAVDSITVTGNYANYSSGRKDSLIFKITDAKGVATNEYNSVYKLYMRGPCFDGDVTDINVMGGNFTQTFENGSYGPYTTTISGITSTSATTATAKINNLYDYFGPLTINFDWTDPLNTKAEIPLQQTNQNYAAGQPFYVRTKPGQPNKFSVCKNRLSFILDVLVNIGGTLYYYDNGVVYTMDR